MPHIPQLFPGLPPGFPQFSPAFPQDSRDGSPVSRNSSIFCRVFFPRRFSCGRSRSSTWAPGAKRGNGDFELDYMNIWSYLCVYMCN